MLEKRNRKNQLLKTIGPSKDSLEITQLKLKARCTAISPKKIQNST